MLTIREFLCLTIKLYMYHLIHMEAMADVFNFAEHSILIMKRLVC